MKIAIDIRTAAGERAGKGWYTFHLVQNLLEIDQENQYILYSKDPIAGFQHFPNAELKLIKGLGPLWHHKVARDCKKENIDLFFAPSSYITPTLLPKDIKIIITIHDLVAFLFPSTHNKKATIIEKMFLKKAAKRADHILTVSKNTAKDVHERFKISPDKITTIYCASGQNFKPILRAELKEFAVKTNLPAHFFLAVGTIIPRKNYLNLIRAFAEVSKKHPNYHLIIVGGKGWDSNLNEQIQQEIRSNYLNKKVHFLGYLSETSLINLYNLATALVFPSFYEGFGIPPLEAMQCGCPVIASYTSSIPEVVGDSALLINPESHLDIAGAMQKLILDPDLRERLSTLGPTQAKKFSWEASAKELLEILS